MVGVGEMLFVHAVWLAFVHERERTAHEHRRSVADKAGDEWVRQRTEADFVQRSVDAVAQVLCRIDESAVKIEDEQLEALDRDRTKNADHALSVMG